MSIFGNMEGWRSDRHGFVLGICTRIESIGTLKHDAFDSIASETSVAVEIRR
jgi:hypothetical protein